MTLEEISDQLELKRLVTDYANAIDLREFDRLDRVFTPDAYIDYRAMGGIDGLYPAVKQWLPQALQNFPAYMHFIGNCSFNVEGDGATGRVACFNPMVVPHPATDGVVAGSDTMFLGLWYVDRYVRTGEGWRIAQRVEEKCYDFNVPEWMRQALGQA